MDLVHALRVFVRVADSGSFVRAAEQLDTSSAAVTRQVAALERHLGARLLNRTTRNVSLTSSGEAFIESARKILIDIAEAETLAGGRRVEPAGRLRVGAPLSFGIARLSRLLPAFRDRYPKLKLDIHLSDRVVDLVADGIDVALRIAKLTQDSLVARPIAPVSMVLCAAPMYLEKHGVPKRPEDLKDHQTLGYSYLLAGDDWEFSDGDTSVSVHVRPEVHANNGELLRELAVMGGGIILQPSFIVDDEIARGALVPLLTRWKTAELTLSAVYLSHRQLPPKVRVFIDYMVESAGKKPVGESERKTRGKDRRRMGA